MTISVFAWTFTVSRCRHVTLTCRNLWFQHAPSILILSTSCYHNTDLPLIITRLTDKLCDFCVFSCIGIINLSSWLSWCYMVGNANFHYLFNFVMYTFNNPCTLNVQPFFPVGWYWKDYFPQFRPFVFYPSLLCIWCIWHLHVHTCNPMFVTCGGAVV